MKQSIEFIPSFDGLRGISVTLVVLSHASYGQINGWIGVDLFFILSGYLITAILQKEYITFNKINFTNFYIRRALRLAPALLLSILFANLVWILIPSIPGNRTLSTFATLFYFNNFLETSFPGLLSPLWSLSVEEHFYIFWPYFTAFFLFQLSYKRQPIILISIISFVSACRIFTFYHQSELVWKIFAIRAYKATFCRIDSILLGATLSLLNNSRKNISFKNINSTYILIFLLIFYAPLIVFVSPEGKWLNTGGFLLSNTLCLVTVLIALQNPNQTILSHPVLRWIGQRSYGIYLFHMPIVELLEILRKPDDLTNLFLVTSLRFIGTMMFAAISFEFIEKPIIKLKNKLKFGHINTKIPATL